MNICTIIPAAGYGKRFGGKKQFSILNRKPVIIHTLQKFYSISKEIVLLLPEEDIKKFKIYLEKFFPYDKKIKVYPGGKYRAETVYLALKHIPDDCDLICIHDGVRPLIKKSIIYKCIKKAKKFDGAIVGVPSIDTVKIQNSNGLVKNTLPRQNVWLIQTPQIFKKHVILDAYKNLKEFKNITDDCQLVEKIKKYRIKLVRGDYNNIKITGKQDIKICEYLMSSLYDIRK